MKTIRRPLRLKPLALGLLFSLLPSTFGLVCHAATIVVGVNQGLQSAIDGAASGDVIVLSYPGDYAGHLSITGKSLRFTPAQPGQTSILGDVSVSNLPTGGRVAFTNLTLKGNLEVNASSLHLIKCTVTHPVTVHSKLDATGNDAKLVVLQSDLREDLVSKAARSWIGYSTLKQTYFENKVEIVGNIFDGREEGVIGIDLNGTLTDASIHNNQIYDFSLNGAQTITEKAIGIRVGGGAKADIRNNLIKNNRDLNKNSDEHFSALGVYVKSTSGTRIVANLFHNNYFVGGNDTSSAAVWASPQSAVVAYNAMSHGGKVKGGVSNLDPVYNTDRDEQHFLTNPAGFVSGTASQDKGLPDPQFNDHDGSRNDIGPNGGRNYLPNGRSTDKPIPIFFSVSPLAVPVGGVITIESTGAAVK